MQDIKDTDSLELITIATGMHLSQQHGNTFQEIEEAGFIINHKVDLLLSSDSPAAITKSIGLGVIGFADALEKIRPDLIVVLGDRFEIFAAVTAALIAGIPVAHLHGGETTEGAFDEALRHSISKMSHLHFVASQVYERRVIQMGESPDRVFLVGGLGIDAIKRTKLLDKKDLEESLDFKFGLRNLLVTFHPATLENVSSVYQMQALLEALHELDKTHIIFTMPNADTGGTKIRQMIELFVKDHPWTRAYSSLGQLRYLSCMQYVDAVVGNSSSGLTEAPSMGIGTINIGDRQKGRLVAESVIHSNGSLDSIRESLQLLYEPHFKACLSKVTNPYGDGGASKKIVKVINEYSLKNILKKSFYDIAN
jgi:GDP/UDP-N,N'-diacetylbacillosamine 2-epimerase (hydrolysing)